MTLHDLPLFSSLAQARRTKRILAVLIKYGFGEFVRLTGLKAPADCRTCPKASRLAVWSRVRGIIEELGPTAIKIDQLLSMRPEWSLPPCARNSRDSRGA